MTFIPLALWIFKSRGCCSIFWKLGVKAFFSGKFYPSLFEKLVQSPKLNSNWTWSNKFDLVQVIFFVALVRSWKFPSKLSIFQFFYPLVKKNLIGLGQRIPRSKSVQPLIFCGSEGCSGWVRSGPISSFHWTAWSISKFKLD